jgi:hypothetical protein
MQDQDAGTERRAAHQQQIEAAKARLDQALAAAEEMGRYHQAILIPMPVRCD